MKRAVLLGLLFIISACANHTSMQRGYVSHRDQCRAYAETHLGLNVTPDTYPMDDKEKNATLLNLFSECMKTHEWKVAGAKKDKDKEKEKDTIKDTAKAPSPYNLPPGYALVPVAQAAAPAPAVAAQPQPVPPKSEPHPQQSPPLAAEVPETSDVPSLEDILRRE